MANEVDVSKLQSELSAQAETHAIGEADASERAPHGVSPRLVCRPDTAEALAAVLGVCDGAGAAVIPWGGGSQQRLGAPPTRADVVLLTAGLNRLVEFEPANLTATVEAGMRLSDLQAKLGEHGQWLPFDPPVSAEATVGGVLATNASGPRRLKEGGLRDLLIGIRVAYPEGVLARAGGRVVKNVTGYDLNKLHIGALGTLGVFVEATFKVAPRPESEATWFGDFASAADAVRVYAALARTALVPSAVEVVNRPVAAALGLPIGAPGWVLLVRASGFGPAVARHLDDFAAGARETALDSGRLAKKAANRVWPAYAAGVTERRWRPGWLTCRLAVPPAVVGSLCDRLAALGDGPAVWAGATGAVFWSVRAEIASLSLVGEARQLAEVAGGRLVVENWPETLAGMDVWGTPGGPLAAMQALKAQYDEHSTLNPGRYVGGI
ncbi:MAG: FAD-binding oxidoreductase [Chloroflexota bacterium]